MTEELTPEERKQISEKLTESKNQREISFDDDLDNSAQSQYQAKQEVYETLPDRMIECLDKAIEDLAKTGRLDINRINRSQRVIIEQILLAYLNNKQSFILEAPTGVGKTIISILTVNAIALWNRKDFSVGYICTSSKALQDQLDRDIQLFNLPKYQVLKGQNNYTCDQNGKPFPQRFCSNISMSKAFLETECGPTCEYLIKRFKAINSCCAVLSYHYWLSTMNFIYQYIGSNAPFTPRIISVMDECHQLSSILQDMFTVDITENYLLDLEKMQDILLYLVPPEKADVAKRANEVRQAIMEISPRLFNKELSLLETLTELELLATNLREYVMLCESAMSAYNRKHPKSDSLELRKMTTMVERESNRYATIFFFLGTVKGEEEWVVRKFSKTKFNRLTVQTLKEVSLFKKHVHAFTEFTLYMSATIGDIPTFARNCGIDNYDYMYMQSDFDFSKSPIYKVQPYISLAMKDKDKAMPILMERMLAICEKLHPNDRGIIHTVNFEISQSFKEHVRLKAVQPGRYLFYDDSASKESQLEMLKHTSNGIIIGPSLIEGLDLKDDLSRFAILAKVPYPALDEFNSKRMKLVPGWYEWKTLTSFLQAIGRSVRHRNDWAITYLMDSCFNFMFKKTPLQPYIERRLQPYDINKLLYPPETEDELFDF